MPLAATGTTESTRKGFQESVRAGYEEIKLTCEKEGTTEHGDIDTCGCSCRGCARRHYKVPGGTRATVER